MGMVLKELVWFLPVVASGLAILLAVRFLLPRVWAVARHTLAEALRMRIAIFFIVLIVVGFVAATCTKGDGTVSGRIQSFLVYSLTLLGFLLALLSIFLSRSLSEELVHRQILVLMTKPIPRWQYLLGKWLGVVLLNAGLLALTGGGIYATVRYMATQPPLDGYDAGKLKHEVLTARHATPFEVPVEIFRDEAEQAYKRNLEEGVYDNVKDFRPATAKRRLMVRVESRWRNVPVGDYRDFEFKDVLCDRSPGNVIQLRYKAQANIYPPDEILRTLWVAGNPDKGTEVSQLRRADVYGRFHTIPFPASVVAKDGTLRVRFVNVNPYPYPDHEQYDNMLLFEGKRGVEVLFAVGSFGGNLIRALLMILCRLMFLTAVALLFSTVFSFPVACLCSFTVYVLATIRQFLDDALDFLSGDAALEGFKAVFSGLLRVLYLMIPDFARYDSVELIADGRNVTLMWLIQANLWLVAIGTSLVMLLACLLFYRREVSEVSV